MTVSRNLIIGGAVTAAGLYVLYAALDIETKEKIMGYVRGITDQLPDGIKAILPTFLLSTTGAVEKGINKTAEKLSRVNI